MVMVEGVLEGGEEAGVLRVVIGANPEEFIELGDDEAVGVGDLRSVAGGAGVAAGASVAVSGDPGGSGGGFGVGEEAWGGRAGRH